MVTKNATTFLSRQLENLIDMLVRTCKFADITKDTIVRLISDAWEEKI